MALVKFAQGTFAGYSAIAAKDANTLYFCSDTHQIFLGSAEYTKGTYVLDATPTAETVGDAHRLYAYNGNLYLCTGASATPGEYEWIRVANVNDVVGSVTSVDAGEGLETESGSPITSTGSIKHSVPTGAAVTTDPISDQTATFGGTVNVQGVATDKFGHVTGSATHTITMPTETVIDVTNVTGTAETLDPGDSFTVVTEVAKGDGSHDLTKTAVTFTLPQDANTTYTVASTEEGKITLTPSEGQAQTITINGWDTLAHLSDITAVFKFKGVVADVASLPKTGKVGDVYHVTAASAEYVCIDDTASPVTWEELGSVIDLSAYALSEDVIQRVTGATGEVPKFNADGTVSSTGFELLKTVPADAVFTDTTYDPVAASASADPGLMTGADKVKLDGIETGAEVNVLEGVQVNGTDLTIDANKKVNVTVAEGATNGTIAVNGSDVAVHGLGTAAFTDSTEYDAAGAAADVLGTAQDTSTDMTVYGVKAYADSLLTWQTF